MATLGNILWHFPFLGFLSALFYCVLGGLLTLTVVAAPIGLGLIQYSRFLLSPFSQEMICRSDLPQAQNSLWKAYSTIVMILYLPFGALFALCTAVQIGMLFLTIVGIPMALVLAKSLGTIFNPVNKVCVPNIVATTVEQRRQEAIIKKTLG